MKNRIVVLVFIILILTCGVLVYSVTRSESIYLNQWFSHIGQGKVLLFLQGLVLNEQIPGWIMYSLPDALWMLALIMSMLLIWNFKLNNKSIPWLVMGITTGILYEVFQLFHLVGGTFDYIDLFSILIAALLPISVLFLQTRIWQASKPV